MSDEKILEAVKASEKKPSVFSRCRLVVKDGHIEAACKTKEDSHELAELLEKEVVIRVKPGEVTEETEDADKVEKDGA
jgi:molybdopterin biosynthesis enzyme